jgi:hypothetical protein
MMERIEIPVVDDDTNLGKTLVGILRLKGCAQWRSREPD